jgi:glycosyltransferase involved in cell wall biosynthesis
LKQEKLVSVIVPVYNIADYLDECIQSIINQTYSNIQIILVDDGSTDESGIICDKYGSQDSRVEVIHKKNGGLVSARKAGVDVAKGNYVCYVDGDDWIEKDTLMTLIDIGQGADIITFACYEEYGDYNVYKSNKVKEGLYVSNSELRQLHGSMLMNNQNFFEFGILPHLWDKLIKRDILSNNQVNVNDCITYGEDAACTYPCILDASSVFVTNLPLYHYRQRTGSMVKSLKPLPDENFIEIYRILKAKFELIPDCNNVLLEQLKYYMWFLLLVKSYENINMAMPLFPFGKVKNGMNIAVYGLGGFGKTLIYHCNNASDINIVGCSDLHYVAYYAYYQRQGLNVVSVDELLKLDFDVLVIAILDEKLAESIKDDFVNRGISEDKIDWVRKSVLLKEKRTVLFGAGVYAKKYKALLEYLHIGFDYFTDNDSGKWGTRLYGRMVIPPAELNSFNDCRIIISSTHEIPIRKQLSEMGLAEKIISLEDLYSMCEAQAG